MAYSWVLAFVNKAFMDSLARLLQGPPPRTVLHREGSDWRVKFQYSKKEAAWGGLYLEYDSQQWTGGAWGLTLSYFVPEFWGVCEEGTVKLLGKAGSEKVSFSWEQIRILYFVLLPIRRKRIWCHQCCNRLQSSTHPPPQCHWKMLKTQHRHGDRVHEGQKCGHLSSGNMNSPPVKYSSHQWDSREFLHFRVVQKLGHETTVQNLNPLEWKAGNLWCY